MQGRQLAYSDDPVLLRAFVTGEWPAGMEFMETWAAAHAIAARGGKDYVREKGIMRGDLDQDERGGE